MKESSRMVFLCFLIVLLIGPAAFAAENKALFPVPKDGKWGYIDAKGDLVIPPQYQGARPFSEGLSFVRTEEGTACLNDDGKVVFTLPSPLEQSDDFCEGMARVTDRNTYKYGFVNARGELVIPCKYGAAGSFAEGLSAVMLSAEDGSLSYAYIDKTGAYAIAPGPNQGDSFSDGLASVLIRDEKNMPRFGFIDKAGAVVISPVYRKVGKFSEGLAFAVTEEKKVILIDKKGSPVAETPYVAGEFDALPVFREGYAKPPIGWRAKEQKEWGFLNKKGKLVFTDLGIWSIRSDFSEGLAWVFFKETGEGAVINTQGKILFRVEKFNEAKEFSGGLSAVMIKGQPGFSYFSASGQAVWPK